jgi:RNA-directed DNA polymerase
MNGQEKSGPSIVARNPANKAGQPGAEPGERREGAKGNAEQATTYRTPSRAGVSPGLDRVRQAARAGKETRFTALLHHLDVDRLRWAYHQLKRDAAVGVDGVTWAEYGEGLEARLTDLHGRVHRGAYRAQPSRRHYIPKPDGRQRPLGIAALEDKIVQRAAVEILNAIYEEDFLGFSYGFRPGRGQHDALDALVVAIETRKVNWILDADIRSFFDTVSHDWLLRFLERRIGDRRILRLIRKWLKVGVLEDGVRTPAAMGTPQGAVISPTLANVYLHYVLDLWVQEWRRRHARGEVIIVRYADDTVMGFEHRTDAARFLADLEKRVAEHALALHPDKTRLIEFGRFAAANRKAHGLGKPETFDFLGFTHICGRTRTGRFQVRRRSRRDRMRAKLQAVKEELRRRMHASVAEQGQWLASVVRGYFQYHGVPNNGGALAAFRYHVIGLWRGVLRQRSDKDQTTWDRINRLAAWWLPRPCISHPWPNQRFAVTHPRWEPYAGCVRRSWYELASASLVRPKPSKQDGSESYGLHGNVGSGA